MVTEFCWIKWKDLLQGGFPAWLLKDNPNIQLRKMDPSKYRKPCYMIFCVELSTLQSTEWFWYCIQLHLSNCSLLMNSFFRSKVIDLIPYCPYVLHKINIPNTKFLKETCIYCKSIKTRLAINCYDKIVISYTQRSTSQGEGTETKLS